MITAVLKIFFPSGKSLMTTLRLDTLEAVYEEMQRYRLNDCGVKLLSIVEDKL